MKILLVTAGSRGDVEPFVALARHATDAGHEVWVAAPDNSGVDARGVHLVSLGIDYSRVIEQQGVSMTAALHNYRTVVEPLMRGVIVGTAKVAVAFQPDVIAYHPKVLSAPLIADALGIPHVLVEMVPSVTPTRAFAAAGTVLANLGALNRVTYRASSAAAVMFRTHLDEAARVVGGSRGRRASRPAATLLPISPALLERPDDWPADVHLTGAWTDSAPQSVLDPEVASFVASGPFVYAGFGSMAAGDPVARGRALVAATRRHGLRLLMATGLGGIDVPPELLGGDVLTVRSAPHDRVLPHASAAVHHGGIGTVQAATRAGTVSIVVPFIADQPFWGTMMHRRGLAPEPIPQRRLTTARLDAALSAAPRYSDRVLSVAKRMSKDGGTVAALRVISALQ